MDILVSLYNSFMSPGYPSLGLLNVENMNFRVLDLPHEVPLTGMGGLSASRNFIFVALQHSFFPEKMDGFNWGRQYTINETKIYESPPGLLVFDRITFKLHHYYVFRFAKDVHSIMVSADESILYAVSTGTDELLELQLEGGHVTSEKIFWRPQPEGERSDNHHLNSIYKFHDDIFISGFGNKVDNSWNATLNGFIYNVSKNSLLLDGIEHPHAVTEIKDQLAFCESRKSRLRFLGDERTVTLSGYTRGLCMASGKIFAATSAKRKKSKSTGKGVEQSNSELGSCTISRISLETLSAEHTVDLMDYAFEIYDLLPVNDTTLWPVRPYTNYRLHMEKLWTSQVNATLQQICETVPNGEKVILIDENTWQVDKKNFPDHQRLHFLERGGGYGVLPDNDHIAITELNRLRQEQEVRFIAFGWPAFWWFSQYEAFNAYLRQKNNCIIESDQLVLFEINDSN